MEKKVTKTVQNQSIISFILNTLLNVICAWFVFSRESQVDVSFLNVCIDIYITTNYTVLLATLYSSWVAKRYFENGLFKVSLPKGKFLSQLPETPVLLAITIAAMMVIPSMPFIGGIFAISATSTLPLHIYVVYKGLIGGLIGAFTCNLVLRRYLVSQRYMN